MDDALRVDEHLDFLGGHAKEPAGLHDLEAFVHEGGGVDGDLCAHVPCGVLEGIGGGDGQQLFLAERAERAAGAGEQDLLDFVVALADEALEDGRVLAVNGQDGHVVLLGELADEFSGDDERLLVGQAYLLAGPDGMDGGLKAGEADHRREHHVDGVGLDDVAEGAGTGVDLDVGPVGEQGAELVVAVFVGDDHCGGVELVGLLGKQFYAVVGCEGVDLVAVGVLGDDVERLCADGAGGAEDADLRHGFLC